jgi:hypothetical protein
MQTDNVVSLSRFRADVTRALARRGEALLLAADLPAQVSAMPPLEFYYVVKEIGVEDAQALLQHANPQQLQACCDLDCWERDDFAPVELDAWLAGFADQGKEALAAAFMQIDLELQVLFLAESLAIYDRRSEPVPDMPSEVPYKETLDGFFVLYAVTEEREVPPFLLVDALYAHDIESAFRLLMAAKWEVMSETTETAYQFRSGRMEEIGFVHPAEAARLFAPVPDAARLEAAVAARMATPDGDVPVTLPALYAGVLAQDTTRLSRAMAFVSGAHTVARLEAELVVLINAATVAYGNATKDLSGVMRVATYVRDTLSLGLEVALGDGTQGATGSDGEAAAAAELLVRMPLMHLFQMGYAAIRPVHKAARALAQDPVVAAWLDVALHPDDDPQAADRAFLRHLTQPRPLWAGWAPLKPLATRAWQSLDDVAATQARLDTLAQRLV